MSSAALRRSRSALTALKCGADLVVELPLPYCSATAQRFAKGGVFLLKALGCVDMLAFGSECGDVEKLGLLAKAVDEKRVTHMMREILKQGLTFAKARERAVREIYGGEMASLLSSPNNALAVEYLREAGLQGLKAAPFTIRRVGQAHDCAALGGGERGLASASYLRAQIYDHALLRENVPEAALAVYENAFAAKLMPHDSAKLEIAVLSHLRRLNRKELAVLPDISEGLEHRFYAAIREARTLEELERGLKTKRYTMARVRRLVLSAFLGVTADDVDTPPPYIRALGFSARGRELLPTIKKQSLLPFGTSLASLRNLGGACERFARLEANATDLYSLGLPTPLKCGYEYTAKGVYLR